MHQIPVSYALKVVKIQGQTEVHLVREEIELPVANALKRISQIYGYSPYIFIYREPVAAFNALHFISPKVPLRAVLQQFPELCVTHNNLQFIQQHLPIAPKHNLITQAQNISDRKPSSVYVIIQCQQETYFHSQTFKLSLDCKILFLLSLASRYGRHACLIYYDFRVPLNSFGKDDNLQNTLAKFCHMDEHIIISADSQEADIFFKSVGNKQIIDGQRYYALRVQGSDRYMVISKQANLRAIQELVQIIYQADVQIVASSGTKHRFEEIATLQQGIDIILVKKQQKIYKLPIKLVNSIFVGTAEHYHCFVEQSCILHLFSVLQPYALVNSCVLHCQPDLYLQQQIPLLERNSLVMYSITRWAIILKYYALPTGILTQTKHYKWHSQIYNTVQCQSLDMLAVNLKNRNALRVFYVYQANNFMDVEYYNHQRFWIGKIARNSHSDGSGHFAVEQPHRNQIDIFDLKKKLKIGTVYMHKIKDLCFCSYKNLVLMHAEDVWVQYNYFKQTFLRKYTIEAHQKMLYSPLGDLLAYTELTLRRPLDKQHKRIGLCMLQEGQAIFSKDQPNQLHTIQYIYDISSLQNQKNSLEIYHSAQKSYS